MRLWSCSGQLHVLDLSRHGCRWTPLSLAVNACKHTVIECLVAYDADPFLHDSKGYTDSRSTFAINPSESIGYAMFGLQEDYNLASQQK